MNARRLIVPFAFTVSLAVAATAVVILLFGSGSGPGSGPAAPPTSAAVRAQVAHVDSLLKGIPETGSQLGRPQAPVTVIYFGDLECPVCRAFTVSGGLDQLISRNVRSGQVKLDYRSFCSATCNGPGPTIFATQQAAALAAGLQHRFWYYTELFYREQGTEGTDYVTNSYLERLARQVPGLDLASWKRRRVTRQLAAEVAADGDIAQRLRLTGTPTVIVSGPHGSGVVPAGVPDYAQLSAAIKQVA